MVERMDGGPRLVIEDAKAIVETFLRLDAGAKLFDARAGRGDADRIENADIAAINQMRARSRYSAWQDLMPTTGPLHVLAALDAETGLFDIDDRSWQTDGWKDRISRLLETAIGPYRRLAVATKSSTSNDHASSRFSIAWSHSR